MTFHPIRQQALAALFVFAFAGSALAGAPTPPPHYTFLDGGYLHGEANGGGNDMDSDGFYAGVSYLAHENGYVFGRYEDIGDSDQDVSIAEGGFGLRYNMTAGMDVIAELGITDRERMAISDSGMLAAFGLRARMKAVEFQWKLTWADVEMMEETTFGFQTQLNTCEWAAITLRADFNDDVTTLGAGVRLYFDTFGSDEKKEK